MNVKTSNRYLERGGVQQGEVVFCPVSGDVEVWHRGECRFKSWMRPRVDARLAGGSRKTRVVRVEVGLSCFVKQTLPENGEWEVIAGLCAMLTPKKAFGVVLGFAQRYAMQIETQIETDGIEQKETAASFEPSASWRV